MGKHKAPNQKSNPSDDNSNKSSKAEKTVAPATEKKPKNAKKPVKQNNTESTEKKAPTKVQKQEDEIKKCRRIPMFFGPKAGSSDANDVHETISDSNNPVITKPTLVDNDSIVTDTTTTTSGLISDYDDDDAKGALFSNKPKKARITLDDYHDMEMEIHSINDNEITKESEDAKRPIKQPKKPNKRLKISHESEVELQRTCDDKIIRKESKDAKTKPKRTADDIDQNSSTPKTSKSKSKNPNQSDAGLISKARSSRETSNSKPNQNLKFKSKLSQNSNENASLSDLCGDSATGNTNVTGGGLS